MAVYQVQSLTFTYPRAKHKALKTIDLEIEPGEFLILCGPSGSGKTTLLKHLKQSLMPVGQKEGQVLYLGKPIEDLDQGVGVKDIGMVFQNPEDQLVMDTVLNELVFSMENMGLDQETMGIRLAEVVHYFGIERLLHKQTHLLSGGEKQLVNLCAVLVLQPEVLIFDEPTAQLDPIARKAFIQLVKQLNEELGLTVIMSAHNLDDVLHHSNRVVYLEDGSLHYLGGPRGFCQFIMDRAGETVEFLPEIPNLARLIQRHAIQEIPLSHSEGRQFLEASYKGQEKVAIEASSLNTKGQALASLKNLYYAYDIKDKFVLEGIDLSLYKQEYISIVGANGSGKSTLLKCLTGHLKPLKGTYLYGGKPLKKWKPEALSIGYVAQNTEVHFVHQTLGEEVDKAFGQGDMVWKETLLSLFNVDNLLDQHPYDLSGGEQEKAAIVLAMSKKPALLLLDEPTKGLDPISKKHLEKALSSLHQMGTTVVCITHDIGFAAKNSQRVLLLFDKKLIFDGSPRQIFTENHYFTTVTNQLMKKIHHQCMTPKDIEAWERFLTTKK